MIERHTQLATSTHIPHPPSPVLIRILTIMAAEFGAKFGNLWTEKQVRMAICCSFGIYQAGMSENQENKVLLDELLLDFQLMGGNWEIGMSDLL